MEIYNFKASAPGDPGKRLDVFLAERVSSLSRSRIQQLVLQGRVSVDGALKKSHFNLRGGEDVRIEIPEPEKPSLEPEDIPVQILYEDKEVIVVNKPAGMVVHPGAGNASGTLVNALLFHCGKLADLGSPLRPGIVHRLDKDTSGVMVVAKTDSAYLNLVEQFRKRTVEKRYFALVKGNVPLETGEIDAPIGRHIRDRQKMAVLTHRGKPAYTTYKVKKRFKDSTLLELKIKTGRTHQIRVHLSYMGYPLLGDKKYGTSASRSVDGTSASRSVDGTSASRSVDGTSASRSVDGTRGNYKRQMLHAFFLSFSHPGTGEPMEFSAPLPDDFFDPP